jgi:hypothetical protein
MRLSRHFAVAVIAATALVLVATASRDSSARQLTSVRATYAELREVARIQAHFDSVIAELSVHPAPNGVAGRRRVALIGTLRAYRDRGVFPHNYDFPGLAVPYFVDRKTGTLCAVAHLLASTGRRDIVDRVAKTNNNVWVAQLAGDSAFTHWLDDHGLSLAEAARIQIPYVQPSSPAQVARNTAFLAVAPLALGSATVASLINVLANSDGHQRTTRVIGFASGAITAGVGAALLMKPDVPRSIGIASAAVGGISVALASRATRRHSAVVAQQRASAREGMQTSLSPVLGGENGGAGVALSIRY